MPHVSLVALSGFRVRDEAMLELGMSMPSLGARAASIGALPALGLLTLGALTPKHWSQAYHEPRAIDDELVEQLAEERPTLVAISALTASIDEAYRLCALLRARHIPTIIGGLHATALPSEVLQHADAVAVGDGEPIWLDILSDAERGVLAGVYRSREPFDLADAPVPRFDLLPPRRRPRFTLQTSRGCPLACDFCAASRLLGPFREKPVARVSDELAALRAEDGASRYTVVELADDNTFAGRRDPSELLGVLRASGVRYFTECDWRLGERPEILRGLAQSGCVQVLTGLESMVHRHRGMGAKSAALPRMMDAVSAIQDAGIAVIGCFVVGSDGETHATIDALGAMLHDAPLADVQLTLQTPFPGAPLRARLAREGRLIESKGWSVCTLFDVAYQPDRLTPQELESAFVSLVRAVFSPSEHERRRQVRHATWRRRGAAP